jgi:hypothetical protein
MIEYSRATAWTPQSATYHIAKEAMEFLLEGLSFDSESMEDR